MFAPVYLNISNFFYPIEDTPATCLTRNLAREDRGDILLLGCGDVRNILFTLHSERNNSRGLDFTCCDMQDDIIARNILLFSLVIADTDGKNQQMIWDIYYHFYLNQASLQFLNNQARELLSLSTSMSAWHETLYGRILRFCDLTTFTRVRALWELYSMQDLNEESRSALDLLLEANIQRARVTKEQLVGRFVFLSTGISPAAPASLGYAEDAHKLYEHYWKHGSVSQSPEVLSNTKLPNPLFTLHTNGSPLLYYGTNPLQGFHLATAFAPVECPKSASGTPTKTTLLRAVEAAQLQFGEWCGTFRSSFRSDLKIRFFTGDAIAFAHALHHLESSKAKGTLNLYHNVYDLNPIELEIKDYTAVDGAPFKFNVIDTSNLISSAGSLNLLSATSPLLKGNVSSTLYTESLMHMEDDGRKYIDTLLCGDLATMSLLLDLFPIEYWTNASSSSTVDGAESDMDFLTARDGGSEKMCIKLMWKRSDLLLNANGGATERRLRFDESDLAHILHRVYQNMFKHEDVLSLDKETRELMTKLGSLLYYHRGSFAVFLRLVKSRVVVDWINLMNHLLGLIHQDVEIPMENNCIEEFYLYLHTLGVYNTLSFPDRMGVVNPAPGGLGDGWTELPETVYITLKVPQDAWKALTDPKRMLNGYPICHCILQSSISSTADRCQSIFSNIQMTFGTITTAGKAQSNDYVIKVAEDNSRWQGKSPLVVSFKTSSLCLLFEPKNARVVLGLQSKPYISTKLLRTQGFDLNILETALGNKDLVYISKDPPNLASAPSASCWSDDKNKPIELGPHEFRYAFSARVVPAEGRISALSGRIDFVSERLKQCMESRCAVKATQTAPCDIAITFTGQNTQIWLPFPAPICANKCKIRIARESAYVEVEAPLSSNPWTKFQGFSPSRVWTETDCVHYIDMETLPVLDHNRHRKLRWLNSHVMSMFSGEERGLRKLSISNTSVLRSNARVSFKDSLLNLFIHFTGIQGGKSHVFGLNNPTGGGIHFIIFVSCMRLDLGSQNVVLDACVLPITKILTTCSANFLRGISERGLHGIKVDDEELKIWRQTLPSFAERCRTWHHRPTCHHVTKLDNQTKEEANDIFCACSRGSLPTDFVVSGIPHWAEVARLVTRVAISPIFSVPMIDPPFGGALILESVSVFCAACGKKETANGGKLLQCGACYMAKYCSSSCQKADWKRHKRLCRLLGGISV